MDRRRRRLVLGVGSWIALTALGGRTRGASAQSAGKPTVTVYKSPT